MQLQRVTTSTRWLPEIDGLRFVAILAVLLVHVLDQMVNRSALGHAQALEHPLLLQKVNLLGRGVQLFFVISGFILAQPFVRQFIDGGKPVSLGSFYLRRITRLEPPYLLSLLLYAAAFVLFRGDTIRTVLPALGAHALYSTQLLYGHVKILNFVTWSLEVEVQFYLLTPLLARVFLLRPTLLRRAVLLAGIALSAAPAWAPVLGYRSMLPYSLCYFLVGFLLADLRIAARPAWRHPLWDAANLLLWPLFFLLPDGRWTAVLLCLLLFLGFFAAMSGPLVRRMLSWKPIAIVGGACYSIYLLHMLLLSTLFPMTRRAMVFHNLVANYAVEVLLLVPCIVAGSMLYYIAVERPCMDPHWPTHLWHRVTGQRRTDPLVTE